MDERAERSRRFDDGLEVVVSGDASRDALADWLLAHLAEVRTAAILLMREFLHERYTAEGFWLDTVEVYAAYDRDRGDGELGFSFSTDGDPHEEAYTTFRVFVRVRGADRGPHDEAFRPWGFAVGFS